MVYFVKAGNFIKVGYSKNEKAFKTRLSTYKTCCPFEVEVIATMEGGVDLERDILNYFIKFHAKGEWFHYDESIVDYATNPYEIPKSSLLKPLHVTNKIIDENLEEIIKLYKEGISLRELADRFGINRKRLITHIPEDVKRTKNEWFKLRKRETNPKNIPIICITTGEKYISTAEASRILGISRGCIYRVLKGKRRHTRNLVFMYLKDFLEKEENNPN